MSSYLKEALKQAMRERAPLPEDAPPAASHEPQAELPGLMNPGVAQIRVGGDELPRDPTDPGETEVPLRFREGQAGVRWTPVIPASLAEAGVDEGFMEGLILKYVQLYPGHTGRQIATRLAVHREAIAGLLSTMKLRKLLVHVGSTSTGDFHYDLSEAGQNQAREVARNSSYVGPAPVPLGQYVASVKAQSVAREKPSVQQLRFAFRDLRTSESLLWRLGPAMVSGRGIFLYGAPGNGKTSLAQRMTRAFGSEVYIPHTLMVEGHIISLFDPAVHRAVADAPRTTTDGQHVDPRWVRIQRPTVVAGGELTLDSLEIEYTSRTGICEAPLQMKANCGTLVIDDFGRQRVDPVDLLNRWIVPLEHRVDYLRLPDGRKFQVPFDPLLVFSTNLDPASLVDEAFLRRIPYKIEVGDPTADEFRDVWRSEAVRMGFPDGVNGLDTFVRLAYGDLRRPMRFCHARDILTQVRHACEFEGVPLQVTTDRLQRAVSAYFTLLGPTTL